MGRNLRIPADIAFFSTIFVGIIAANILGPTVLFSSWFSGLPYYFRCVLDALRILLWILLPIYSGKIGIEKGTDPFISDHRLPTDRLGVVPFQLLRVLPASGTNLSFFYSLRGMERLPDFSERYWRRIQLERLHA